MVVKSKQKYAYIYLGLLFLSMFIIIIAFVCGRYDACSIQYDTEVQKIYPDSVVQLSDDVVEHIFHIEDDSGGSKCLEFFSSHQNIIVYVDDSEIYQLSGNRTLLGTTPGSKFNFVDIPVGTKEIRVQMEAVYKQVRGNSFEFYYGNGRYIYAMLIKDSVLAALSSTLIVILGILIIIYWHVMRKKAYLNQALVYLGIFAAVLGSWLLAETDFCSLIVKNRTAHSFMGYILMMQFAPPFITFITYTLGNRNKIMARILRLMSYANIVICTVLHMTGVADFKETVYFTHAVLIISILYLVISLVLHAVRYGIDRKVRTNLIGTIILVLALIVDMRAYYIEAQKTDVLGRIGFLIYIAMIALDSMSDSIRQINAGKKAEIYREMAITDALTGLYNRNAFDSWENENKDFSNIMLVTFDLNNLKWCNDTLGHAAGDKYIVDAANMIHKVFGKFADCYRIGGDEFCVVIKKANEVDIERYLGRLVKYQKEYNSYSKDVQIQIACGYARFNESDRNIESTRERADVNMYENKRELKNQSL